MKEIFLLLSLVTFNGITKTEATCGEWPVSYTVNGSSLEVNGTASEGSKIFMLIKSLDTSRPECNFEANFDTDIEKGEFRFPLFQRCSNVRYSIILSLECEDDKTETKEETIWIAPEAPANVKAEQVTESNFLLKWDSPPGSIRAYRIELNARIFEQNSNDTFYEAENLQPNTDYYVRVSAKGEKLWSDPSDQIVVRTPRLLDPPSLELHNVTNTTAYITWRDGGDEALLYTLRWHQDSCCVQEITTSLASIEVEDLTPFTNYSFDLRVSDGNRTGNWSDVLRFQTEPGLPFPPGNVTEIWRGSRNLSLEWEEPRPSRGDIIEYRVTWKTLSAKKRSIQPSNVLSTNETWIVLEKLKPARTYIIQVSASTIAGMGNWSEPISIKTLSEPPFPPRNIEVTNKTEKSLSLKWDHPDPRTQYTGKIEFFTVQWNAEGNESLASLNTTYTNCTVESLMPFTIYRIRLKSWNNVGPGKWSDDMEVRTSAGVPSPPRNIQKKSVTNSSIEMVWDEPFPNVGTIRRYKIKWMNLKTENVLDRETLSTSFLIEGLTPYTNYSILVQAKTDAGYGAWSDPVTVQTSEGVPSSPRNLRQKSVTNTSIEMAWDESSPEVGPILLYKLRWTNTKNSTSTEKEVEDGITYLIQELNPYTNYSIMVQAKTSAGYGTWSEPVVIETSSGVPHFPENLQPKDLANTSVEVRWDSLDDSMGPIVLYKVMWAADGSDVSEENETGNSFYIIQNLKPYTNYSIQVQAKTTAGYGPWSHPLRIWTDVGVPPAPREVRKKNTTDTSIEVEWDQPIPNVGPIDTYRIECADLETSISQIVEAKGSIIVIGNLNSFRNYSIRVQAETIAGAGSWSHPVIIQTDIGVPSVPHKLGKGHVTNQTIEVKWEEPRPYKGPIEFYTIFWDSGKANTAELKYLITDLTPYTDYNISVRAKTEAGYGRWSSMLRVKTDVGIPSVPQKLVKGHVTNQTIEVKWEEPQPYRGPIESYTIFWGSETAITTQLKYLITDLTPYTDYNISVQAKTEAGYGNWAGILTVKTGVGIPFAPEKLRKVHVTNRTIEVRWEEPQPYRGPIKFYSVQWDFNESITSELKYQINDLTPYTNYNISVRAKTEAGYGNWSSSLNMQTKIGIPSIPRNVTEKDKNSTYLHLMWLPPDSMNGPLDFYRVQCSSVDDSGRETVLTKNTTLELFELFPYTEYSFQVSASTVEGWSEPSPTFKTRTGIAIPSAARFTDLKVENSSALFVEWIADAPYPGPTTFYLFVKKWPGPCEGGGHIHDVLNGSKSRDQWKEPTRMRVPHLNAYSRYSVQVSLKTEVGETTSDDSAPISTPAKAPGPPTNVRANCEEKSTEAEISWSLPVNPNAKITHYFVEYGTEYLGYREMSVKVNDVCQVQKITLRGLKPERDYKIFVRALGEGVSEEGKRATSSCRLPAGVPPLGNPQWIKIQSTDPFHLSVTWNDIVFSDAMGSLIEYSVIVGKSKSMGEATRGKMADDVPSWANYSSGWSEYYQATPSGWNPFLQNDDEEDPLKCKPLNENAQHMTLQCTLGLESHCEMNRTHCNSPLQADTFYWIKLRAFTRGGYSETGPLAVKTAKSSKPGLIGGLVGGFLIICGGCLILGLYLVKRKGGFEHVRKIIESRFLQPAVVTPQSESCLELETYQHGRCIKIPNFCEHVRIMLSDSHLKFSEEFEALRFNSPKHPCTAAEMEENRHKNRWMNIFPYDHSRVKLLPLGDEPASDFINANYIVGDSSLREYIASQGPLANTVDDFWRMIWEQSSTMIVMLTQLVERGKVKCEKYWPDEKEAKYFGDIQVRLISESMLSSYIIRVFHLQLGSQERMVKQMHFTHWPDFGCPERPEDLINFVRAVRDHLPRIRPGPIVVHCSAGVGRTGTFISVDRLAQKLRHSDGINIFETVMELRQHRINMVQTEDQYIYIHSCVQQLVQEIIQPPNHECNEPIYSNVSSERDTGV